MTRFHWLTKVGAALAVSAVVALPLTVSADGRPTRPTTAIPRYQHIFYVMMENHNYGELIGNPNAPVINRLAQTYGLATNYYGVTHPSEPNYVASIGGSYFGIQDDAPYTSSANGVNHTITAPSLADQLDAAGLTWKTYQQALPYAGYLGTAFPSASVALYASKHNPFLNFASVQNNPAELQKIVPDTQLFVDLLTNQTPNFSYIVPDQCHDMHGTSACADDTTLIQQGDIYVGQVVDAITHTRGWAQGNNAIVVTWDEDDYAANPAPGCCDAVPGGGHVATIVITNHGPRGVQDPTAYNHYSLLRTIQDAFGLGCLQNTCDQANVTPMAPLFSSRGEGNQGDQGNQGNQGS